jgi:hypothetical protein
MAQIPDLLDIPHLSRRRMTKEEGDIAWEQIQLRERRMKEQAGRARQIRESRSLPLDALKPLIALSPKALEALLVARPWQGRTCGGGA